MNLSLADCIVCPNPDHGALVEREQGYQCTVCGAEFAVRNGIPVLLPTGA